LRDALRGRAKDFTILKKNAEALSDWDEALKFDDGSARLDIRSGRADSLARLGRSVDAVREAAEVAADPAADAGTLYDCGRTVSLASGARDNPTDAHAAHAVILLRQAIAKGYAYIRHLLADADLAPLHSRADYADLLWDLADTPAAPVKP
jgi:hypothetical protein